MSARPDGGPDAFLATLRAQPGAWNAAKAEAFERLWAAFPDPEGPPEWGLRQILRGQFDRRLPAPWRPAFVEVYHQWLGWRAESEHLRAEEPWTFGWWRRSLIPSLRTHGWAGSALSPLAVLLMAVAAAWCHAAAGMSARSHAQRRAEVAMERTSALATTLDATEHDIMRRLKDGSTDALQDVAGLHETARRQRRHVREEAERMEATLREEAGRAARSWWWPW